MKAEETGKEIIKVWWSFSAVEALVSEPQGGSTSESEWLWEIITNALNTPNNPKKT